MSAIDYYSLDDILVTQERVPCTFNLTVPKLGKLNSSSDSDDIESNTKVELPLWLASQLSTGRYPIASVQLPKVYTESYREILKADACVVNLYKFNVNFFEFGCYVKKFDQKDDVSEIMIETFQNRFRRLMDVSGNVKRNQKVIEKFDNLERKLYYSSNISQRKLQTWLNESKIKMHAAEMVISHRKRKRVLLDNP